MVTKKKAVSKLLKAEIGMFDGEQHSVVFKKGDSVKDLANKVGIETSGKEVTDLNGNSVDFDDEAKSGVTYVISKNYKNGLN